MHLKRMFRMTGAVVIASVSSVAAQASTFTGTVVDTETKTPISDVVVTATSPALQGQHFVVTDAQGKYLLPELPPGTYTLRFDKEGFHPHWRSEITVRPDRTLRVNVELLRIDDDLEQSTLMLNTKGFVDYTSSTTRTNVEEDFTRRLALNHPRGRGGAARSFESLVELAPGVEGDAAGVSIHGASPFENAYVVDGLSIQDPVSGAKPLPLSVEFLQDLDIFTSGIMPEHGRATGGIIRARTRSGSNAFHGSVFGNWVPGLLGGPPTPISNPDSIITRQNAIKHQGDIGATLGGPLVKNRLWFFAGVVPSGTRVEHTRTFSVLVPGEDGVYEPQPRPGQSQTFLFDQRGLQALGKLTYQLDSDQSFSLSAITTPTRSSLAEPLSEFQGESESNFTTSALTYAGAFMDERLRVDARLGWSRWTDSSTTLVKDSTAMDRYQANVQASWRFGALAGIHLLEAGVDADRPTAMQTRSLLGAPNLSQTSRYTTQLLGGFVQDSWNLFNRVTLNAGVRYDTQWVYTDEGKLAFALDHQLSPRVGLVVDPIGATGRMRLFAHYAKYPGQLPLSLMQRAFPPEQRPTNNPNVDPELVASSSSELVAGAEYQVIADTRLSATYTRRHLDSVVEGMSRDDGNTYFLGNPGSGLAREFPEAERTYDAVTVALNRIFERGWLAQASYTWSRLEGNYTGPAQGDFALVPLTQNRSGLLPYDRTHSLKLFGAKQFHLARRLSANLGLSYRSRSGTPINYLGAHPIHGPSQTFVLPRGSSGERTPWVHTVDSNVGLTYRLGRGRAVSLSVDVFNLFNFQAATHVDQNYTYASVLPVTATVEPGTLTPGRVTKIDDTTGESARLRADDLNRNFKNPVEYQAPRQVRLGLRYSF